MSTTTTNTKTMDEAFFEEYTSHDAILKYSKGSAGYGVSYLLDHDYKDVYLRALESVPADAKKRGIRILEFGCGAGMNLVHLVAILTRSGVKVEKAVGTDFSPVLIEEAKKESQKYLRPDEQGKIQFHVAKNESLIADISAATGAAREQLLGSFDFIIGVNTFRYCHRGGREMSCVRDIKDLLIPGGVCANIDMNDRFPLFRSAIKNKFRAHKVEECYIPPLEEYAAPFEKSGFEILRKQHFCWVSHSATKGMTVVLRALSPILSTVFKTRAMRSLVVARKPLGNR
ncbi:MAG TPA: class I SAM-dependent methyltransferase [Verrucomicrobiae bacterium]|nr:class I SAM-dependent methyltransferase [Verrucomicrobiae bacterium]